MRGGSDATRYFASFLNKHDGGIMPKTDADKRSLRINLDQNVVSRVTLSLNGEFAQTIRNPGVTQNENNGLAIPSALGYAGASWLDLRKRPDGTYPRHPFNANNPFQTADLFENREDVNRSIISARLQAELWTTAKQSLRLSVNGGRDLFTQKNKVVAPRDCTPSRVWHFRAARCSHTPRTPTETSTRISYTTITFPTAASPPARSECSSSPWTSTRTTR